jgi:hypothetical protein
LSTKKEKNVVDRLLGLAIGKAKTKNNKKYLAYVHSLASTHSGICNFKKKK